MPQRIDPSSLHPDVQDALIELEAQFAKCHPEFLHVQLTLNNVHGPAEPVVDVITALGEPVDPGRPMLYVVPDIDDDEGSD